MLNITVQPSDGHLVPGRSARHGRDGRALGETGLAEKCRRLFEHGRAWLDAHLFNGEYYEHEIRPPLTEDAVAPGLRIGSGATDLVDPELQLGRLPGGPACGAVQWRTCAAGVPGRPVHIRTTLDSLMKYNFKPDFYAHFNHLRSFVLNEESALVMASYPHGKRAPGGLSPITIEVMTGFEYTAGVSMLYEGQLDNGLKVISAIRRRYDGRQRSPSTRRVRSPLRPGDGQLGRSFSPHRLPLLRG